MNHSTISPDKFLFTPGPLTTSASVKQAMMRDLGSRDHEFIQIVREVRERLVRLGNGNPNYCAVLMQGSGTFGIEAVISSVIPPEGKLLVLVNGAYGERMVKIAEIHKIDTFALRFPENSVPDAQALETALVGDPTITHVAVVHCETTTGIINPIRNYGEIISSHGRAYIVDAMSSFGAYPLDLEAHEIDYLVSSSNKCIEGVPGFSFVLACRESLEKTRSLARTLSLDLYAQWQGLEGDGQFRFTPPIQAILAFRQALVELEQEGGVTARAERYMENYRLTLEGMQALGFTPYLAPPCRGYIITSFYYLEHPNFDFNNFYSRLSEKGQVIYPGKLSHANCFRIGHIGQLRTEQVRALLEAVALTLNDMGVII
jgi:2-aminoethylphosphonate-pyruvate transaminase